jgi:hypothetical protein
MNVQKIETYIILGFIPNIEMDRPTQYLDKYVTM